MFKRIFSVFSCVFWGIFVNVKLSFDEGNKLFLFSIFNVFFDDDNFDSFNNKIGSIDVSIIWLFFIPFVNVSVIVLFIVSFNDKCSFKLLFFVMFFLVFSISIKKKKFQKLIFYNNLIQTD